MKDILFSPCHYFAFSVMYPQAFKKGDDLFVQRRVLLASYVFFFKPQQNNICFSRVRNEYWRRTLPQTYLSLLLLKLYRKE